jgi:hypothetical protein
MFPTVAIPRQLQIQLVADPGPVDFLFDPEPPGLRVASIFWPTGQGQTLPLGAREQIRPERLHHLRGYDPGRTPQNSPELSLAA